MAGKRLIDPAALLVRRRNYVRHFEDVPKTRVFLQKMLSNQYLATETQSHREYQTRVG